MARDRRDANGVILAMALLNQLSITEAVRDILSGRHRFTDPTRITAQRQVRHYSDDAIYAARAPQADPVRGYVLITKPKVTRFYTLAGEDNCCDSYVLVGCYSKAARSTELIATGARVALSGFVGRVTMQAAAELQTYGCFVESEGEQQPEEFEASADFSHAYFLTFRIRHEQIAASGAN